MADKKSININIVFCEDSESRWERIFEILEDIGIEIKNSHEQGLDKIASRVKG